MVYYESLCNEQFLRDIFQRYRFTHVIHVAAQAGVRYSLTAPLTYVTANVECQVAIFEAVANFQQVKFLLLGDKIERLNLEIFCR